MAPPKKKPPITLSAAAFEKSAAPATPARHYPLRVVDAHVHIWDDKLLPQIQWIKASDYKGVLDSELGLKTFETYTKKFRDGESKEGKRWKSGAKADAIFSGIVYLQVDSDFDDSDTDGSKGGWDASIKEIDNLCESSIASPSVPLLAIIPWAPLPHGPEAVQSYISKLLQLPSLLSLALQHPSATSSDASAQHSTPSPVRGFRYLLDNPTATAHMLDDGFITALQLLGSKGYVFEVNVNVQEQGLAILDQVSEMVKRTNESQPENERTKFIIDHFGKPSLKGTPTNTPQFSSTNPLSGYLNSLFELALQSTVYLKLSGLINEYEPSLVKKAFSDFSKRNSNPALSHSPSVSNLLSDGNTVPEAGEIDADSKASAIDGFQEMKKFLKLVLEPALESFGESRIIFGTDWPRYRTFLFDEPNQELRLEELAYEFELALYRETLVEIGLEGEALDRIFFLNAKEFYSF
ncbi:hypothetical protein BT69DRAFT_1352603 [Atractiella rhizophila]|nr:hypothetical protein BT69DRAFT_1352603 [Atractiella rhizophila]